jgi:hypothetical protein
MTNEGIDSPYREPQSPSRSISQKVSVADVLGQTVGRDSNNHHAGAHPTDLLSAIGYWLLHSSPERADYSRRDQTAIDLSF